MSKQSQLNIQFELDVNEVPEKISWESVNGDQQTIKTAKAAFLSFWDQKEQNTMSLDLWTKEMSIEEMSKFYFQKFMNMADAFEKATNEDEMALSIREFAEFFGEKLGVIPKTGKFETNGEGQA